MCACVHASSSCTLNRRVTTWTPLIGSWLKTLNGEGLWLAVTKSSFSIAIGPGRRKISNVNKRPNHQARGLRLDYGQTSKTTANRPNRRSNVQKYKYKSQPGKLDEHFHSNLSNFQKLSHFLSYKRTNFHSTRKKKWLPLSLSSFFFLFSSFPTLIPPTNEMRFCASHVEKPLFQRFPRSASVF